MAAYRVNVLGEKEDIRLIPGIVGSDQEKRQGIVFAKSTPLRNTVYRHGRGYGTMKYSRYEQESILNYTYHQA